MNPYRPEVSGLNVRVRPGMTPKVLMFVDPQQGKMIAHATVGATP